MKHISMASKVVFCFATALLFAGASLGQSFETSLRCAVGISQPNLFQIVFRLWAGAFDLPAPQAVAVVASDGQRLPFKFVRADYGPSSPPFIVVSPSSGVTPALVWVGVDPTVAAYMAPRSYGVLLRFSLDDEPNKFCYQMDSPILLTILSVLSAPTMTAVVNAATLQPDLSPGTVISIQGTNLTVSPPVTARYNSAGLYPTELGNVAVALNGKSVPLLSVSSERVDAVIPHSFAGETSLDLVVKRIEDRWSQPFRISLQSTSPGIFKESGSGGGLGIYNQDGTPNGETRPAPKGAEIQIRATGAGVWNRNLPDGSIALSDVLYSGSAPPLSPKIILSPQAQVSLTIGGQPAEIRSAGPVPYEVFGTLNIVAVVPEGIGSGPQPVVLTIGENSNVNQQVMVVVE